MALRGDGRMIGSVSGGCVEDDLIARAQAGQLPGRPERVTYGVTGDEAARFGLPCGGTLRLVVEPLGQAEWLDPVLAGIDAQQLVRSEEHTSELQSLMRISYAVFCLKKKKK